MADKFPSLGFPHESCGFDYYECSPKIGMKVVVKREQRVRTTYHNFSKDDFDTTNDFVVKLYLLPPLVRNSLPRTHFRHNITDPLQALAVIHELLITYGGNDDAN